MPIYTIGTGRALLRSPAVTTAGDPPTIYLGEELTRNWPPTDYTMVFTPAEITGSYAEDRLIIVGYVTGGNTDAPSDVWMNASGGDVHLTAASAAVSGWSSGGVGDIRIWQGVLPAGETITTMYATVTDWGASATIFTAMIKDYNSTTATDAVTNSGSSTSLTASLETEEDGVLFTVGARYNNAPITGFTGDETFTEGSFAVLSGGRGLHAIANATAANATSDVTLTISPTAELALAAVSYR